MTEPATAERFRSRGPSQTVQEDRGPVLIEPTAGGIFSRFKKRTAIHLPTGMSRAIFLVAAFLVTLTIFTVILLGPIAHLIAGQELSSLTTKEQFDALNGIRQTLVAAAAGFAASAGLAFTGRTYGLSKRGQEVDRFVRASSMLASEQQTERTGGLLAMEQMIREGTREAQGAVEVLQSFIRERGRADPAIYESALKSPQNWEDEDRCPHDVEVAMIILGHNSPFTTALHAKPVSNRYSTHRTRRQRILRRKIIWLHDARRFVCGRRSQAFPPRWLYNARSLAFRN
jgi:hypothetical protein